MGVAELVAEIIKYFTGSKQSSCNLFLHRFTQLPAHIYLKDCLAFSRNHKPLTGFWEGAHEVLKLFADLSVKPPWSSPGHVPQVPRAAALHLRKAPVTEGLFQKL